MRKVFAALAVLIVLSGCAASTQQPDSTDDLSQQTAVQEQTEPQDDAEEAPVVAPDQIEEPIDEEAHLPELQPHYQDIVSESKPAPKEPVTSETFRRRGSKRPTASSAWRRNCAKWGRRWRSSMTAWRLPAQN